MKTFWRLLSYSKPYRNFLPRYALTSVLGSIFGIVNFTLLIPVLNVLFKETEIPAGSLTEPAFTWSFDFAKEYFNYLFYTKLQEPNGHANALLYVCLVILASVLFSNLFYYLGQRTLGAVRSNVVEKLRHDVFSKVYRLHIGFFTNERKGDIMSRLTNDIQEVENSIISSFTLLFRDPITIIFVFITLFKIDAGLTLFTLVVLPISGVIIGEITKRLKKTSISGQEALGEILGIIDETIGGMRVIKAFNAEGYVNDKFSERNNHYAKLIRSISNLRELASPLSQFMGVTVVLSILYYGGMRVIDDSADFLSAAEFMTFIILFAMVLTPAKAITASLSTIQRGLAAGERVFELIDTEPAIQNRPNARTIDTLNQSIQFENVSFSYKEDLVLKNINLTIPKGKSIALVGPSGGGKSTMIDLIPRFYNVTSGRICIDGNDVLDLNVHSLRGLMGIVTQESILFNDTIFNNIAFGINASEEQVIAAAKIANAHDFIINTEHGYQTYVGDRGSKLSGGQRQRITIARAVLKNPPILLLDEATSALDSESEHLVQEALEKLMQNRTSIIIAHRFSTIQHVDQIVVINKGEIVEVGNHEELMALDGLYKKLNLMQSV